MLTTLTSLLLAMVIPLLLVTVTLTVSTRSMKDREKSAPFECGFDPKSSARLPFSLRFFLLAVIFLVFDIEIMILIPTPLALMYTKTPYVMMSSIIFIMILVLGLLHEWNEGSLDWT